MRIRFLGPTSAEVNGAELPLGGLKQRAVFALLALNAGRVVSLDRLVQELWSDEPPSRSTLTLQSYVSRLRRVLGDAETADAPTPQILTRPPGWILAVDPDDVDVMLFARLVDEARVLLGGATADAAMAATRLRTALGLWRGDAFADLESVSFAREEALRLSELRLSATELLFEAMLDDGETDAVADEARRFVATNPFRERAWCSLMVALYRSGRQSEAIAAAAELRTILLAELGLDPSREVQDLEQLILRQDPSLGQVVIRIARPPQGPEEATAPGGGVAWASAATSPSRQLLVGRRDALATFDECVAAAVAGNGRLVVLNAPAGFGKSVMLDELAHRVLSAGGITVRAGGAGAGVTPPLWPWVSVVHQLAASSRHAKDPHLNSVIAATLELLEPDMSGARTGGENDASLARTQLYRRVIDMLAAVRARSPVAVLFDDAHWIDGDTLTLLSLAVAELTDIGVLFALAARTDEDGTAHLLDRIGGRRREVMTPVPLRALNDTEVVELVDHVAGAETDPAVSVAIRARTAGNPLFVTEMVRLLSSERRLDAQGVAASLPHEVRDVLRRRLQRLPQQSVALLTVLAVVHGTADVALLREVSGLDTETVLNACESALIAELLVEEDGGPGRFALGHDLVRQALEEPLSRARLVRLHARVAAAMLASGPSSPEQTVAMARHLTLAAPLVGPAAAVPYLIAACEHALTRFANDQAERYLREALALAGQVSDVAERSILEASLRARLALLEANVRGVEATATSGQQKGSAVRVGPPTTPEATAGWLGAMVMTSVSGDMRAAVAAADEVLKTALPPIGEACARFVLGFSSSLLGRWDVASAQFSGLERLLAGGLDMEIAGTFSIPVAASVHEALVAHVLGDEAAVADLLTIARTRSEGSERALVLVEQGCSWVAAMRGDTANAHTHATACIQIAQRLSYPIYDFSGQLIDAWARAKSGEKSCAAAADASYAAIIATGLTMLTPFYLLLCAEAHEAIGDVATARDMVRRSRALSQASGDVLVGPRLAEFAEHLVPANG